MNKDLFKVYLLECEIINILLNYIMPTPVNKELYQKGKDEIYAKYPKHNAYRSGLLV